MDEVRKEKAALTAFVIAKRENIKKVELRHREALEIREKDNLNQIKKVRDEITSKEAQVNQEIVTKIKPQTLQLEDHIEESKEEYATLVQEVD